MTPLGGSFNPSAEVDEMRWLSIERAAELLTYRHDRSLLETTAELLS
jgi:8-oxo-dGTP diphosphatase